MSELVYLALGFSGLAGLSAMLVLTGKLAADCPQIRGAAKLATTVITTGFVALGVGIVCLIAAFMPELRADDSQGLYLAIGSLAVALGIGFYLAASMLRDLLAEARKAGASSDPAEAKAA